VQILSLVGSCRDACQMTDEWEVETCGAYLMLG
jgi:hypothetical protein